jgi:acyl dehydratase
MRDRRTVLMRALPVTKSFLEDFSVGQIFESARLTIDAAGIKRFAAEFDPQPFHLDEEAAGMTLFCGLAASGWHTAAITMRLHVESEFRPANGIIGAGFEELRWPRPVHPADELRVRSEVLAVRISKSRPEHGFLKLRATTFNQVDQVVQVFVADLLVPSRPK